MAREVLPEEAEALRREGATLVDVRRAEELAEQRIPGAVHVPLDELGARAGELPDGPLVLVCRSGDRSAMAADALAAAGHEAASLAGGLTAWAGKGLPTHEG